MKIGNKELGSKPYIIAEIGQNHGGSVERAKEMIKAAADAGASAVKFQTYTADELVVKGTPRFWDYHEDDGKDQWQAYEDIPKLTYDQYPELMKYCEECGIEFLSTPFSFEAADKLNELGVKAFKIASSDMSTLPFLRHVAKFGKPILLSTGAATMEEVRESVKVIRDAGNDQVVVMQCTLCYPTKDEDANLAVIQTYKQAFPDLSVGLSDHTLGTLGSLVGIHLGAQVIEKHFTTDKTLTGNADHWLSVDPKELREIVDGTDGLGIDMTATPILTLVGSSEKKVLDCEKETRLYDKRSIVAKVDIPKDTPLTLEMLTFKRPGTGIWPNRGNCRLVVGGSAKREVKKDSILTWDDVTPLIW